MHFVDDEGKHRAAKVLDVHRANQIHDGQTNYLLDLIVFKRPNPLAAMRGLDDVYPTMVRQDESEHKHKWTWHFPEEELAL